MPRGAISREGGEPGLLPEGVFYASVCVSAAPARCVPKSTFTCMQHVCVICHVSKAVRHMSLVEGHESPVASHTSRLPREQVGEPQRRWKRRGWRVGGRERCGGPGTSDSDLCQGQQNGLDLGNGMWCWDRQGRGLGGRGQAGSGRKTRTRAPGQAAFREPRDSEVATLETSLFDSVG